MKQSQEIETMKSKNGRRGAQKFTSRNKIPIEYLIELREKDLTHEEISKLLGCSRETISRILKKENIDGLDRFRKHEAKIWSYFRRKIFQSISDNELRKASLAQKFTVLGICVDKEKIISGKVGEEKGVQINIEHLKIVQNAIGQIGAYEISKARETIEVLNSKAEAPEEIKRAISVAYEAALK